MHLRTLDRSAIDPSLALFFLGLLLSASVSMVITCLVELLALTDTTR